MNQIEKEREKSIRVAKKEIASIRNINSYLNNENIPKDYLENMFNVQVSKEEADELNEIMKFNNTDRYQEFIGLALENKSILNDPDCPDLISYIEALKYISYLNIGKKFDEAYVLAKSRDKEVITMQMSNLPSHKDELKHRANMYSHSRLVLKLQKLLDIPYNLALNGYKFQAYETLYKEMRESSLSKDRIQAADRLLTHLTPVLEQQNNIQINVNTGETKSIVDKYKEALEQLTKTQLDVIKSNKEVDTIKVINITPERSDDV